MTGGDHNYNGEGLSHDKESLSHDRGDHNYNGEGLSHDEESLSHDRGEIIIMEWAYHMMRRACHMTGGRSQL